MSCMLCIKLLGLICQFLLMLNLQSTPLLMIVDRTQCNMDLTIAESEGSVYSNMLYLLFETVHMCTLIRTILTIFGGRGNLIFMTIPIEILTISKS